MRPRARTAGDERAPAPAVFDPLRFCIFTTVALIAWAFTPPFAVALMSGMGLAAYGKAVRGGLRRSRCFLGDVRLVMAYLGVAFAFGLAFTARSLASLLAS